MYEDLKRICARVFKHENSDLLNNPRKNDKNPHPQEALSKAQNKETPEKQNQEKDQAKSAILLLERITVFGKARVGLEHV